MTLDNAWEAPTIFRPGASPPAGERVTGGGLVRAPLREDALSRDMVDLKTDPFGVSE